ncbi:helix-turn-helix domain-containing protein [Robbsia sp. Bb-Pol-6]|uniref:Helix-turn-helix domain-containing protein n=1 Tax=Robbsia betulipollinis TaxID=2981849 RepID=A0ABT3ZGY7_9BURK|nr:helix-turn-helix domain-containing protein [Robbsia betulipollinis]MCY0385687.1 helix-turn-helix domain-containing protein [Robbsia betulipollinis]
MTRHDPASVPVPVVPSRVGDSAQCVALGQIIDRVADKWAVMTIGNLSTGSLRFNELMRRIPGVSHRMLTLTLRGLQRDGIVDRTAFATVPPRVDYALTELGKSLIEPLGALARWAESKQDQVLAARANYDTRMNP